MNYQKKIQNDSCLYDHSFYTNKWLFLLISLFFGIFSPVFGYFFFAQWEKSGSVDGQGLFLLILFVFLFFVGVFGFFWVQKKVALGINRNGVFIRYHGLIPWGEIKGFALGKFKAGSSSQKCIIVLLHDPENFFSTQTPFFKRINIYLAKGNVLIMGNSVSIPLEKLIIFLQTYQKDVLQNS